MKISVIIPVYNEAGGLPKTVATFQQALAALPSTFTSEIIVVNDGSTDGTFDRVTIASDVRRMDHPSNRGYGASLKTGIRAATGELIVICDADGSYDIQALPRLVEEYRPDTLVVAARQTIPYQEWRFLKMTARRLFTVWLWLLTGRWISDINSGFRLFERSGILPFMDALSDRFSFTTGLTLHWIFFGRPIIYLSTPYFVRDGASKVRFVRDAIGVLRQTITIARRHARWRLVLALIASVGVLAALSVLLLSR